MREEFLERSEEPREGLCALAMRRMLAEQITRVNAGALRLPFWGTAEAERGADEHVESGNPSEEPLLGQCASLRIIMVFATLGL